MKKYFCSFLILIGYTQIKATPITPYLPEINFTASNLDGEKSEKAIAYIEKYNFAAMENMRKYGIPASIILAQGILESNSGNGKLACDANNHFGIKCKNTWTGETISHDDDAKGECFRKYKTVLDCYEDHALFLTTRSHYNFLFSLDKTDYKAWANGLKKAGYATDPKYPDKLIGIIERYELYKYDQMVIENKDELAPKTQKTDNKIILIDQNTYQVKQGDTLYSIAKENKTTPEELMKINLMKNEQLNAGQFIKIQ